MPINIICKECGYKQKLMDIDIARRGEEEFTDIMCLKCGRTLIKFSDRNEKSKKLR